MIFEQEIIRLEELLGGAVYVVGGAVRNVLLGLDVSDVDIASAFLPVEVIEKSKSEFDGVLVNERLGTVKLTSKTTKNSYEHTTFRVDSYPKSGKHRPLETRFISSLEEDASRRDFTVNAIYFEPKTGEMQDPTGGILDISERKLNAVYNPQKVFSEDGLRIMRLCRFAAELGFEAGGSTFSAAKKNVNLLGDIAPDRVWTELEKTLYADQKYPSVCGENAAGRGIKMLGDLGALDIIFSGFSKNKRYHTAVSAMGLLAPETRLAALFLGQNELHVKKWLAELRASGKVKKQTETLVALSMGDVQNNKAAAKTILNAGEKADEIVKLKRHVLNDEAGAKLLESQLCYMRENNLPFDIKGLLVSGNDLINLGIEQNKRSECLQKLLVAVSLNKDLQTKDGQIKTLLEDIK